MISLNYRDSRPIYEQIKENLRRLIISGSIPPGERLPSVRELATQLTINPNTIQRAYRELESEGYVETVLGKGSFASNTRPAESKRVLELFSVLESTVSELKFLGIGQDRLIDKVKEASL